MLGQNALLERDAELAEIAGALRGAATGSGGLLIIEGEAGVGKSALLDVARSRAQGSEEMRVLSARGGEYEREFPFGVVRQLFEPLLVDGARREELLGRGGEGAAPVFDPAAAPAEGGNPFAIQHGLYTLLLTLAETSPVLVLIDDAQWADLASLRALTYIGRRLGDLGAVMLLTVRTGEPGEHEGLLEELRRTPGSISIEPRPLSLDAVSDLIAAESEGPADERFSAAVRGATGGNPFLLLELLRGLDLERVDASQTDAERLAAAAAGGASRTILARLTRLGDGAVAAARATALLEPNAEARWIAALSGLSPERVAEACERLIVARLLSDTRPVSFVHPLIRAAVLSDLPQPRRAADHAEAARLLAADGAPGDAVASHLLRADPAGDGAVAAQLRAAGAEAIARGVPATAISYLRRALREPPPPEERVATSHELGRALLLADEPEGIEVLRALRGAAKDPLERAAIANELSVSLAFRRPGGEGVDLLEESLAEVAESQPELALLLRGQLLLQTICGLEGVPGAIAPEREHWPDGETLAGRFLLRQLSYLHAIGFGSLADALELAERSGTDLDCYAEDVRAGMPAHFVFAAQTLADRGDLVPEPIAVAIETSKQRGAAPAVGSGHAIRAYCRYFDGDLAGAQSDIEIALRLTIGTGLWVPLGGWLAGAVKIALARGEIESAQRLLDEGWQGRAPGPGLPGAFVLIARGELRAASGRHAEARHDFLAAGERLRWLPYANPEVIGWRTGLALSESALGNTADAQRLAAEATALAREAGGQRGIGLTLRVQGLLTFGEDGIELLQEAADTLGATRARLQYALALTELGAALRRANRRRDARPPLRESLELAHLCGAKALEERARTELAATGARPRKAVLSGVHSLTPSELRVAQLAAEGMTNREIAQSLFVTAKTVETHLRHVYQKLNIASRGELASALAS